MGRASRQGCCQLTPSEGSPSCSRALVVAQLPSAHPSAPTGARFGAIAYAHPYATGEPKLQTRPPHWRALPPGRGWCHLHPAPPGKWGGDRRDSTCDTRRCRCSNSRRTRRLRTSRCSWAPSSSWASCGACVLTWGSPRAAASAAIPPDCNAVMEPRSCGRCVAARPFISNTFLFLDSCCTSGDFDRDWRLHRRCVFINCRAFY